jgi:hypothetical protein
MQLGVGEGDRVACMLLARLALATTSSAFVTRSPKPASPDTLSRVAVSRIHANPSAIDASARPVSNRAAS